MACCFIGHRKIQRKELVFQKVKEVVEKLIVENGERVFYFGSKSEFDALCHKVVTEFQSSYPDITRINYNLRSEYVVKKEEREKLEKEWSSITKKKVVLQDFEGAKISDKVYGAGIAVYVERNQEMIDDSEICVFFYREGYSPERENPRQLSKKSGTKLAYDYAARKKKTIVNIAEKIKE